MRRLRARLGRGWVDSVLVAPREGGSSVRRVARWWNAVPGRGWCWSHCARRWRWSRTISRGRGGPQVHFRRLFLKRGVSRHRKRICEMTGYQCLQRLEAPWRDVVVLRHRPGQTGVSGVDKQIRRHGWIWMFWKSSSANWAAPEFPSLVPPARRFRCRKDVAAMRKLGEARDLESPETPWRLKHQASGAVQSARAERSLQADGYARTVHPPRNEGGQASTERNPSTSAKPSHAAPRRPLHSSRQTAIAKSQPPDFAGEAFSDPRDPVRPRMPAS